jgi:vanillate O-demethylase ferredoxin subunit
MSYSYRRYLQQLRPRVYLDDRRCPLSAALDVVRPGIANQAHQAWQRTALVRGGSHVDVVSAPGLVVRQYSLCNDPAERHRYCLGIPCDSASRGVSEGAHASFAEGQAIRIRAPRCNFHLVKGMAPVVLAAGGIGIAPLLSMAHAQHRRGVPFVLPHCTRSADRTAFAGVLAVSPFVASVQIHHDDGVAAQRFVLADRLAQAAADAHIYVCGPEGFINHVAGGCDRAGWAPPDGTDALWCRYAAGADGLFQDRC